MIENSHESSWFAHIRSNSSDGSLGAWGISSSEDLGGMDTDGNSASSGTSSFVSGTTIWIFEFICGDGKNVDEEKAKLLTWAVPPVECIHPSLSLAFSTFHLAFETMLWTCLLKIAIFRSEDHWVIEEENAFVGIWELWTPVFTKTREDSVKITCWSLDSPVSHRLRHAQ